MRYSIKPSLICLSIDAGLDRDLPRAVLGLAHRLPRDHSHQGLQWEHAVRKAGGGPQHLHPEDRPGHLPAPEIPDLQSEELQG